MGEIIRTYRKRNGLTLTELARLVGVTAGHISQIERGGLEPSLGLLRRIAQALSVPVQEFFDTSQGPDIMIIASDDAPVIQFSGYNSPCRLLSYRNKNDIMLDPKIKVMEISLLPGQMLSDDAIRSITDECCFVTAGIMEFTSGEEVFRIGQGASLFIPAHAQYTIQNGGEETARMIWAHAPDAAPL